VSLHYKAKKENAANVGQLATKVWKLVQQACCPIFQLYKTKEVRKGVCYIFPKYTVLEFEYLTDLHVHFFTNTNPLMQLHSSWCKCNHTADDHELFSWYFVKYTPLKVVDCNNMYIPYVMCQLFVQCVVRKTFEFDLSVT